MVSTAGGVSLCRENVMLGALAGQTCKIKPLTDTTLY